MSEQTYQKMPPENKKAWLEALRSGEYVQGRGILCRDDGAMCCLGVAIDVLYEGDWVIEDGSSFYCMDGSRSMPTLKAAEAMGLSLETASRLAGMNDAYHMSFGEIADWIEWNL